MQCPQCHTDWSNELAGLLKFCGACGAPLGPEVSQPASELRFVTVLFADIADFTTFSEEHAADEVAQTVGGLLQKLGNVVTQHGGTVEKYIGDAIMATFGLPRTDPAATRNAVRAGLALQAATEQFCREHQLALLLRIGIHNGEVMFVPIGGNWTVMGDTVNTANRIQSTATPGKVWISRSVYDEVRRFFTLTPRPAVELKGKKQSVQPYEVVAERVIPFMEMSRFVGREQEWAQLQAVLQKAVEQRTLQVILVRGPAGIGKSRLVWELRDWVQRQHTIYRLNVVQYDHSQLLPAHGLNSLLRSRFELPVELNESELLQQLKSNLAQEFPFREPGRDALVLEFFAFALGVLQESFQIHSMDGKGKWDGVYVELKRWLEGWAAETPWLLFFEDAQKGDAETAAFWDWALQVKWTAPVLVVITIREEDFNEEGYWYGPLARWLKQGAITELHVKELAPQILAQALIALADGAISDELAQRIAEHTEGNPLFATELVLLLKEQDRLANKAWDETTLPATIREVMEARLERLGVEGKEVAKRGALMGRRFTQEAVARIWERSPEELGNGLNVLRETETIYEEASKLFVGEVEEVFRHGRLQEAALARIPREERARWLGGLGSWARAKLEGLGRHWQGAGPLLLPLIARSLEENDHFGEASLWYEVLGWLHRTHHRGKEAIEVFRKALALAARDAIPAMASEAADKKFITRQFVLGRLIAEEEDFAGDFARALETVAQVQAIQPGFSHPSLVPAGIQARLMPFQTDPMAQWEKMEPDQAAIMLELTKAAALTHLGNMTDTQEVYQAVETQLEKLDSEAARYLRLRWGRAWIYFLSELAGNPLAAEAACRKLRQDVDLSNETFVEERAALLYAEGLIEHRLGHHHQAQVIVEERLKLLKILRDRRGEISAWNLKGITYHAQGKFNAAREAYEQSLAIARLIGDRRGEVIGLYNLSLVYISLGEWEQAHQRLEHYLALSRVIGNHPAEAYGPIALAGVMVALKNYEQAAAFLAQGHQVADTKGWVRIRNEVQARQGQLALLRWIEQAEPGLLDQAVHDLQSSEEAWGLLDDAGEFYATLVVGLLLSHRTAEARILLKRAQNRLDVSWEAARAWLDLAAALVESQPVNDPLAWFRNRNYASALILVERWLPALEKSPLKDKNL